MSWNVRWPWTRTVKPPETPSTPRRNPRPTVEEWAVACEGRPTSWHTNELDALTEAADLTRRGFAPVVYPAQIELAETDTAIKALAT